MTSRQEDLENGGTPLTGARAWTRAGYLAVLAFALLSPLTFRWDGGYLAERVARLLSPGTLTPGDAVDAARNVLLLAGWGLIEVVTDSGRSRRRRVLAALAGGAAIGISAEVVQLALPERTPSLLDAAMNAAGAGVGALATDLSVRVLERWRRRPTALGVPAAALAAPYVLAVFLEAAFPLLRNQEAGLQSGGPLSRIAWSLEHFRWESITVLPPLEVLLFLPAGFLAAVALWEAERTRETAFTWAAVCGVSVAILGELAHAPLGVPIQLGPLAVHAAAFVAGARVGVRVFPRWLRARSGTERVRDFLWAYVLVLVLWRLRPFVPELDPGTVASEFSLSRWSPLSALGARRDLYSVSDILRSFLLFVPLGAAVAARERTDSVRTDRPALRAIGWILGLAFLLEGGQALVAERFFDGTDLLVMAAGATVTWAVARVRADR